MCAMMLIHIFSITAFAQNDVGSIVGFITDQSGAVVPNAKITITNEGTGELRTVSSDTQGRYTVPNLAPTVYTMTAEAAGFQKFVSIHNTLASNTTIDIDAKLTVGQATQTVEVSDTAACKGVTQSGAVQSEITGVQVQKQELNGRNPIYMTQLLPGVNSTATLGDFNYAFNSGDTFRINGARTQDTQYTLDGAPAVRTRDDGEIIAGANVDAVQEIQVLTANYSPEYGGASGAQVRIVTKSGTTNFHGGAYEYLRNSAMNANTWERNLNPATQFPFSISLQQFWFLRRRAGLDSQGPSHEQAARQILFLRQRRLGPISFHRYPNSGGADQPDAPGVISVSFSTRIRGMPLAPKSTIPRPVQY